MMPLSDVKSQISLLRELAVDVELKYKDKGLANKLKQAADIIEMLLMRLDARHSNDDADRLHECLRTIIDNAQMAEKCLIMMR